MRRFAVAIGILAVIAGGSAARAATINITTSIDNSLLQVAESTVLHVYAQILDGEVDNGIYAYALECLFTVPGMANFTSVVQLGSPDAQFSSPGFLNATGAHDIYGGDGGFFIDKNRGVASPFELLRLTVVGAAPGATLISTGIADNAVAVGIPDGILLQRPGSVNVNYGAPVTLIVVPEPSAGIFLLILAMGAIRRRAR